MKKILGNIRFYFVSELTNVEMRFVPFEHFFGIEDGGQRQRSAETSLLPNPTLGGDLDRGAQSAEAEQGKRRSHHNIHV